MNRRKTLIGLSVALAAITILTLLAGGVALANSPKRDQQNKGGIAQIFIDKLAENLDMKPDELRGMVKKTEYQMVEEAVRDGKLSAEQGSKIRERIDQGDLFFTMPKWGAMAKERVWEVRASRAAYDAIAGALNLQPKQLMVELKTKSIAQIAEENRIDPQHVKDAAAKAARDVLDQGVALGQITKPQADRIVEKIRNIGEPRKVLKGNPAPKNNMAPKNKNG